MKANAMNHYKGGIRDFSKKDTCLFSWYLSFTTGQQSFKNFISKTAQRPGIDKWLGGHPGVIMTDNSYESTGYLPLPRCSMKRKE